MRCGSVSDLSLRPTVGNRPPAKGLWLTGVENCQAARQHLSLNGPQAEMTATSPHSHGEEEHPLLLLGKATAQRDTVTQKFVSGEVPGSQTASVPERTTSRNDSNQSASHGEEERPLLLPGKVAAQRDIVTQKLVGQLPGSRLCQSCRWHLAFRCNKHQAIFGRPP